MTHQLTVTARMREVLGPCRYAAGSDAEAHAVKDALKDLLRRHSGETWQDVADDLGVTRHTARRWWDLVTG